MEMKIDTSQINVLKDFFDELSTMDQRKIFMASFRKAAKPLIVAARINVPKERMNLYRSIGSIELPQQIAILVGSKVNTQYVTKKGRLSKVWYGNLLEEGTKQRFRKSKHGGGATGKVTATHFFENAFNITQEQMYDNMAQEWYNEIDKYIIRMNKKLKY